MHFRVAGGVFVPGRYAALVQAIVNIVVSVIGAYYWGLAGIYLGTVLSGLVIMIWRPIVMYKHLFNKSAKQYFWRLGRRFCLIMAQVGILWQVQAHLPFSTSTIWGFCIMFFICLILPVVVYWTVYRHAPYAVFIVSRVHKYRH